MHDLPTPHLWQRWRPDPSLLSPVCPSSLYWYQQQQQARHHHVVPQQWEAGSLLAEGCLGATFIFD